jgi:hypothetical protein
MPQPDPRAEWLRRVRAVKTAFFDLGLAESVNRNGGHIGLVLAAQKRLAAAEAAERKAVNAIQKETPT